VTLRHAPTDTDTALTTVPRIARARNVGVRQLRAAIAAGELPAYQIGKWHRVRPSEVDRWIERQRVGGA
jgi:excisionase family DNA binding protein